MNSPLPSLDHDTPVALYRALARRAVIEDREAGEIGYSVDLLRKAGWLDETGREEPARMARRLMRIAGANLSLARLYEGHVNALRLIELHGNPQQLSRALALIAQGGFLGVWGAEGERPLREEGELLNGAKIFASGLGTVSHAVVSVGGMEGRIGLVPVRDSTRQSPQEWRMPGMRATRSGGYDFTGVSLDDVDWIGEPGCYPTEPGFVSGVWRIAALQLGATLGLLDAAARRLRALERMEAEAQLIRLGPPVMRTLAADGLVLRAARFAESDEAFDLPERAAVLSATARLLTEELGQHAIAAVEQSIGLGHFEPQSETGRIARDLAVYMRQAARDALTKRVGAHVLCREASIWELLDD